MPSLEVALRHGVDALELDLSDAQISALLDYIALIQKWTRVYNLTAVRDPEEMLTHHVLDSLAVVPPLRRQLHSMGLNESISLLDVGSGAGLPGVVLAICCPAMVVHCVDTVAKKAAFIQQAAVSLKLPLLRGIHARVESLTESYAVVTSRAFASLADFTVWSKGALADQGVWMAMKGKNPEAEVAQLPAEVAVFHVEPLVVPGLAAERCLVWMRKASKVA
ncbi:MAG: 16S rRNA (guanine(527)-N(7))-methyltransferase RsmG [Comamonadaceae bacterium]|nr:MAG: 16S rRNA (guanine(527)-N(7))-methyltransferase RsmG [Comamonadaceae bacterium]